MILYCSKFNNIENSPITGVIHSSLSGRAIGFGIALGFSDTLSSNRFLYLLGCLLCRLVVRPHDILWHSKIGVFQGVRSCQHRTFPFYACCWRGHRPRLCLSVVGWVVRMSCCSGCVTFSYCGTCQKKKSCGALNLAPVFASLLSLVGRRCSTQ